MTRRPARLLAAAALALLSACAPALVPAPAAGGAAEPPPLPREFRAAWVATVANIDWPSRPGLPTAEQQRELVAILDRAKALNLNAIVLQVRPATDAIYPSALEPWSEYLTGEMGKAPAPAWDPLEFAVRESHERGIELHAWFNPYRARQVGAKSAVAATHVSRTRPDLVREYGRMQWMDPGEPETQAHSLRVILDVVKRYDVDGVHLDDYFYPYKVAGPGGKPLDFPDSASYARYAAGGGTLGRDDWRRRNVDEFVRRMYDEVKRAKPWVKVGISPFGIARPGQPEQACCFDQYSELYADARKWLREGWLDYWTPQLYWKISAPQQSYPMLLKWWAAENVKGRHLWPGNFTSRVVDGSPQQFTVAEIDSQVRLTRAQPGATGNVHFSMKALMRNPGGLTDTLQAGVYAQPALIPESPWMPGRTPGRPQVRVAAGVPGQTLLELSPAAGEQRPWQWVVRARHGGTWTTEVVPGASARTAVPAPATRGAPDEVLVFALDPAGRAGPSARVAGTVAAR
ncbi:family 10 glycosylhydrolase [Roseisolibacter sp. H3M3-2]|uniref:glycoside hydrolase family 10 protein n=1 Tax=Roseisolibacter sp. H3M3-2 TaxID=3031323 RepID=UPI0023DA5C5A|nr:family 10 glycosylhydrolase [Roseisolibacter sp. H3M3-2]MDF1502023.1 family 10 glycosylhydrolase [Roseisolibacter sp. H3M3-2]